MNQSCMPWIQESGRKEHKQGSQWLQREEQVEEMKCKLKQSKREIQQEEVQKLRKERDVMKWGDALKEIVNQM